MHYICKFSYCPVHGYRNPNEDFDRDIIAIFSIFPEGDVESLEYNQFSDNFLVSIVGEYATLDEAQTAFSALFPEHRDADDSDIDSLSNAFNGVVEVFKPGKFEPLGPEGSLVWINDDMTRDINADTTDEEIAQLGLTYEQEANDLDLTLDEDVVDALRDYRDELRDAKAG